MYVPDGIDQATNILMSYVMSTVKHSKKRIKSLAYAELRQAVKAIVLGECITVLEAEMLVEEKTGK